MAVGRRVVCVGLVALAVLSFEGVRRCGFLHYDDDLYITGNPHLAQGLTPDAVRWAFTADLMFDSPNADYWAPLTVLTRLIDVELFGMRPAGPHLVNLGLHALAAMLLFLALRELTGALWRSAMVAAVFATHPLHVESVAWLTERKDVLSAFFWMLALLLHALRVRAPSPARRAAVAAAMACGLMAKPMLVTFPFVLLLLDGWPLGRLHRGMAVLLEKAELFALSLASVAISVHTTAWMSSGTSTLSWGARAANAVHAYFSYARDALWPAHLAVGYPHASDGVSAGTIAAELAALVAVTVGALAAHRRRGYLLVGWCWYLGVLLPVVGLVQIGIHGRADRYTYLPLVGLSMAVVWWAGDWAEALPARRRLAAAAAALVLAAFVALSRRQVGYWKDDFSLFSHATQELPQSAIAHNGLAAAWLQAGRVDRFEAELRETLRLRPDLVVTTRSLSNLLAESGRLEEASALVESALRAPIPRSPLAASELHLNLGWLRVRQGRGAAAQEEYAAAVRVNPRQWAALYAWGNLLVGEGKWADAEARYRAALAINPDDAMIANNLGLALLMQGHAAEAVDVLAPAARAFPAHLFLRTSYGRALHALGRDAEAETVLQAAVRDDPRRPEAQLRLAQVLEARGRVEEARGHYQEALRLDPGDAEAAAALRAGAGEQGKIPR